ncbi:polyphenol oxidase, chloroplastic [Iris pallida]|uniref:Polyphenol oxidase, chloroplastic n=1 Tax=Iris pallida TaxID=29817 RepID=A0AAX6HUM3_IRIPA|nr:polyphenol oxidase, chloroplastic [Iris pallida]
MVKGQAEHHRRRACKQQQQQQQQQRVLLLHEWEWQWHPLSPNLSTCHPTSSQIPDSPHKKSHEVNCCPASPDSGEPIVRDFQFPSPSSASPVRIRRPAHRLALDREYLAKYNKAVAIMKRLPPDHPHSWHRQAQIHCLYCNGAYYQAAAAAADVPFMVHESWLFFPFHRFYVYFHERILGKLIGDDTFALPYWNYDSPDGMPIPDIYMKGELHDMKRATRHLPPAPVAIDYTPDKLDLSDEPPAAEQTATNLALLYQHMVSGASKPELFMGCKLRPERTGRAPGWGRPKRLPTTPCTCGWATRRCRSTRTWGPSTPPRATPSSSRTTRTSTGCGPCGGGSTDTTAPGRSSTTPSGSTPTSTSTTRTRIWSG